MSAFTPPRLLPVLLLLVLLPFTRATELTVHSLAELRAHATTPGLTLTLAPGTYWLTGPSQRPSPAPHHPIFLDLAGDGSTYVFTGVTLRVDTRELRGYGRAFGHDDTVRVLQISGQNATVLGLDLRMEHVAMNGTDAWGYPREFTADWSTTLVEIIGSGVSVRDCSFTTGGSFPYGFGDAFGKGGRPADSEGVTNAAWISHNKHSGIRLGRGASGITLENIALHMRSFGHGIFLQDGVSNITIRDSAVLGDDLASSDDVIAHPVYQQWGFATYREKIPAGIRLSRHEDGIRNYTNNNHATNGWPQYVHNLTIENTRVERMRDAFATGDMSGFLRVTDSKSWGCEMGFTPSQFATENTFLRNRGDAVNGPLVFFRRSATNVTMEAELAGADAPVGLWPVALISGSGHQITLTRTAPVGVYPESAYIVLARHWREWRHRPSADLDAAATGNVAAPASGIHLVNQTGLPIVFGTKATDNTATSDGPVINLGTNNTYVGETLIPGPTTLTDTWGQHTVFPGLRLASNLLALGGVQADAGTRVLPGATLQIASGLTFVGEPLALGGTLTSPGATNTSTRFNVNDPAAAPITLTGDATIGVTTATHQFLVGPISGAGHLTKTGPGHLVMENAANTFIGPFTIAAGTVTARANKVRHDLHLASGASLRGNASLFLHQSADHLATLDGTLVVNSRADASAHTVRLGRLHGSGLITSTGPGLGTVEIAGESFFQGVIEGPNGLLKTGPATTLHLTAVHTYSGPTHVEAGTLAVSGQLPATTTLSLAADTVLARDLTLGPLTVAAFFADPAAVLRPSLHAPDFDPRQTHSWPLLHTASLPSPLPSLDASDLPPTTGAYSLQPHPTHPNDTAVLIVVHTPSPFAAWQYEQGIPAHTSPTATSFGDTISDLQHYALGHPTSHFSPQALTFTVPLLRPDIRYVVERSTDLQDWTPFNTFPADAPSPFVYALPPPPANGRLFYRLRLTWLP